MNYSTNQRISVMFPTRNRVDLLRKSLNSLIDKASSMVGIEILIAIDDDDQATIDFVNNELVPEYNERNIVMKAYTFPRLGYSQFNRYMNYMADESEGNWLFLWNDDAIMVTENWDLEIEKYNGQFKVLRFKDNHNEHPNAIFPCIPKDWVILFGTYSPQMHVDSWISQIAYLVDIMETVHEIEIIHDRHDLTGAPEDATAKEREFKENDPEDPDDINHPNQLMLKVEWAQKLNWYLHQIGQNTGWFDNFRKDPTFDVWSKFRDNDPNKQCYSRAPDGTIR